MKIMSQVWEELCVYQVSVGQRGTTHKEGKSREEDKRWRMSAEMLGVGLNP